MIYWYFQVGYNIKPNREAKKSAEIHKVRIEFYNIIYKAIEFVENNLSGLLLPDIVHVCDKCLC